MPQSHSQGKTAKSTVKADTRSGEASFGHDVQPVIQKYCVSCHTGKTAQAGIDLSVMKDASAVLKDRGSWELIAQNIASGHMPPANLPAPTKVSEDAAEYGFY